MRRREVSRVGGAGLGWRLRLSHAAAGSGALVHGAGGSMSAGQSIEPEKSSVEFNQCASSLGAWVDERTRQRWLTAGTSMGAWAAVCMGRLDDARRNELWRSCGAATGM